MTEHVHHDTHGDHDHGAGCGHESFEHEGHTDYLHDGHSHAMHEGHWDEHAMRMGPGRGEAEPPVTERPERT